MSGAIQRLLFSCLTITAVMILIMCLLVIIGAVVLLASSLSGSL